MAFLYRLEIADVIDSPALARFFNRDLYRLEIQPELAISAETT
jgi:hypothetical protein